MESRSELLQTQDQNLRPAEYNAAWRANTSSGLPGQKLRTSSAPDGLRSMLTAIQGAGSDGSTTSQEMREDPSISEARQEGSLSPTESSPTVASARNTGPSTLSAGFPGSAASSLDGVRERAEAVLRDAESVLKQEPNWAADGPAQASRPSAQPSQPGRDIRPFSDSYTQHTHRAGSQRTSIAHDDLLFQQQDQPNGHGNVSELPPAPGQGRLLTRPRMSSFDSPEQPATDVPPQLQHRSPDAARGNRDSPSGVTHPLHNTNGEHL